MLIFLSLRLNLDNSVLRRIINSSLFLKCFSNMNRDDINFVLSLFLFSFAKGLIAAPVVEWMILTASK